MARIFFQAAGGVTPGPTDIAAAATYPAAGVSVTAVPADAVVKLRFVNARGTHQVNLEDSQDGFNADIKVRKTWSIKGPFGGTDADNKQQELVFSFFIPRDCPGIRYGTANDVWRINVTESVNDADGNNSLGLTAYVEY